MSAETAIHFRDPFTRQRGDHIDRSYTSSNWSSYPQRHDINRALTPPQEMNGVAHSNPSSILPHEHAHQYGGDYMPSQQTHHAGVAQFLPQMLSHQNYSRPSSRAPPSPEYSSRQARTFSARPQSRRGSQAAIAPSFQIPKSINDSGGSLSELAAQMTCLFWFESSDVLEQIEDSSNSLIPSRSLVPDARPTTGFRKWVTTILSTTCVAQNVVLLALLFIHRLKKLNPTVRGKPGSEYRLLTVALMLGNKFLDDNTYTNKTWAEVSGINVAEVHIMEVEFLSNMKYCLFTSAEDWTRWQSLLGKFAAFFDRASRPVPTPSLPPPSSLHLPMPLPSPPSSNQASPPYLADPTGYHGGQANGPTPAPSPMGVQTNVPAPEGRKRSRDELSSVDPPPKRLAAGYPIYSSQSQYSVPPGQTMSGQQVPRLTLPSLSIPSSQSSSTGYQQQMPQEYQLPPLSVPNRSMGMVYPNASNQTQIPSLAAVSGLPSSQHIQSQPHSTQQSPYGSPTNNPPLSSTTSLQPPTQQLSPTHYYLKQRNSPYRPVHNVSTLINPPPTSALQHRAQSVEYDQMHYQPLGKPFQQRQSGRLPYVSQNVWVDANTPQAMTPVSQWPSFHGRPGLAQQTQQQQQHR